MQQNLYNIMYYSYLTRDEVAVIQQVPASQHIPLLSSCLYVYEPSFNMDKYGMPAQYGIHIYIIKFTLMIEFSVEQLVGHYIDIVV